MHLRLLTTAGLMVWLGCSCTPDQAPLETPPAVRPYVFEIVFAGLVTLAPDNGTLSVLLGDFRVPTNHVIHKAPHDIGPDQHLAPHEARLYYEPGGQAAGWAEVTVDGQQNCDAPEFQMQRFVRLSGDDLTISGQGLTPPFSTPAAPRKMPQKPTLGVKKDNFFWTPDLRQITGQKVNASLALSPCPACVPLIAARLMAARGQISTGRLHGNNPNDPQVYDFPNGPKHALPARVSLKMTVQSGPVVITAKDFSGAATNRKLVIPRALPNHTRRVWLVNKPSVNPPTCPGGRVDFIGHCNLLENPAALVGQKLYPRAVEPHTVGNPQLDGQCSPARGGP